MEMAEISYTPAIAIPAGKGREGSPPPPPHPPPHIMATLVIYK